MEWLSKWLLFVGFCRLSAVYFGFFDVWALRLAVFSKLEVVQDVHGRTFAVWTLLTCTLCLLLAFNLDDRILYLITFLSFVYALGYFLIECFIYGTMAVKNLASMFFSQVWNGSWYVGGVNFSAQETNGHTHSSGERSFSHDPIKQI